MSKVDEAWRLFSDLQRQYPFWPSTFSPCKCGRQSGRGSGPCAICIQEQLEELVGFTLADAAAAAVFDLNDVWVAIREELENEHAQG